MVAEMEGSNPMIIFCIFNFISMFTIRKLDKEKELEMKEFKKDTNLQGL